MTDASPPVGPARRRSSGASASSASSTPSSAITSTCSIEQNIRRGHVAGRGARARRCASSARSRASRTTSATRWLSRFVEVAGAGRPLRRAQPAPQPAASRSSSSSRWRSASAPTPRSSASSTACCCGRCPTRTATSSSSSTTARRTRSPTTWASRSKDIADYRARRRSFSDIVEFHQMCVQPARARRSRSASRPASSRRISSTCSACSRCYGRTFVAADDAPGAPAVLVLSYKYWQRSFGGDPNIVGRVFRMNDKPHTVVGVLPPVPQYPLDATSTCRRRPARSARRTQTVEYAAGADADRLRPRPAGRRRREVAGGSRYRRGPAREGVSGRLSAVGVPRHRGAAKRS